MRGEGGRKEGSRREQGCEEAEGGNRNVATGISRGREDPVFSIISSRVRSDVAATARLSMQRNG